MVCCAFVAHYLSFIDGIKNKSSTVKQNGVGGGGSREDPYKCMDISLAELFSSLSQNKEGNTRCPSNTRQN